MELASQERQVCRTHVHQFYDGESYLGHDIALLFLDKNSTKDPILKLDTRSNRSRERLFMDAIGFGMTSETGIHPEFLQVVKNLEYINNEHCDILSRIPKGIPTRTMLCAKGHYKGTCKGMRYYYIIHACSTYDVDSWPNFLLVSKAIREDLCSLFKMRKIIH